MHQRDLLTDERRLFEDLCSSALLRAGFQRVKKNKGSPGIDGVTIAEFESRLDEELSRLTAELESWTYKPSPVRHYGANAHCYISVAYALAGGWHQPRQPGFSRNFSGSPWLTGSEDDQVQRKYS